MKPRIITTGLTGLVGSKLQELLSERYSFSDISLPKGDILDFKSLERFFKRNYQAEIVLHLAAFTNVGAAWHERGCREGNCYRINVLGTKNIVHLCEHFGKYLIYVSTDFVFNGQKEQAYTEKDLPSPIEWYGRTKLMGEEEVKKTLEKYAVVRIAFPYCAEFNKKSDLVRKILRRLRTGNLYPMFTDQITTPTFIDDIVYGLEKFFQKKPVGIYHLVASSFQSPYELACQIAETFGFDKDKIKKGSLADYKKKQSDCERPWHDFLGLSNQKIKEELGIEMSTLQQGLEKMKTQLDSQNY
jgi:dTDP-4-dehydrorhamnose reductase